MNMLQDRSTFLDSMQICLPTWNRSVIGGEGLQKLAVREGFEPSVAVKATHL